LKLVWVSMSASDVLFSLFPWQIRTTLHL
jgi:hypothetical protein